jgi:hypothetical protein
MTLIATAISRYGIVQAVDARLTSHPQHLTPGRRIFSVGFASASLSVTGSYSVDGRALDEWVVGAIDDYERSTNRPTLRGLAERLRDRLPLAAPIHRRMIHLAGYATDGDHAHPELYFLRNFHGTTPEGDYDEPGVEFFVNEQFWTRDHRNQEVSETLASGGAQLYLNGAPQTRIAYRLLNQRLHDFYRQLWSSSKLFRSPQTLQEIATLVDLDLRVTAAFLGSAHHQVTSAPNGPEIELIPAPSNAVEL